MRKKIVTIIFLSIFFIFTVACKNKSTNKEKQCKKNSLYSLTKKIDIKNNIINAKLLLIQIKKIKVSSPHLYLKNRSIYKSVENWLKNKSNINDFYKFGIHLSQMKGVDNHGNVKISGYYTPIIQARKNKKNNFIYPIYSIPYNIKKRQNLPKRKEIYNGILDKKYILAYSNSLVDNFIMEIQGSAFIDYGNNQPLTFFSYSGNNGWPYKSIGQILINRGAIKKKNMSMQAIKKWCKKHTMKEIKDLFEENKSFVFFKETKKTEVYGASSVPLIEKTSIAVDNSIVKNGSIILLKIPVLNKHGIFINKYEMRLVIALDVGGAIKGQHFDIYEGIGEQAGILAGFYNHYGYAWILDHKQ